MPQIHKITSLHIFAILWEQSDDEVDFLHADNYESFLQIENMVFDGDGQAFPEFSN